jgi:hypothetical protein
MYYDCNSIMYYCLKFHINWLKIVWHIMINLVVPDFRNHGV